MLLVSTPEVLTPPKSMLSFWKLIFVRKNTFIP